MPVTAICTFLAGFALAHRNTRVFLAMLAALVVGWLLVATIGPEDKTRG